MTRGEGRMLDHNTIVRHAYQLQPLPPSCSRLASLAVQEVPDLQEITEVISFDPVLTARLLRVANSAHSASHRAIGTVKDAVIRLGPGTVLGLTVGSAARKVLDAAIPGYALSPGELWRHSVAAALAADLSRSFCAAAWSPLCFTAALLHDIGKLVLGRFLTPDVVALCQRAAEEGELYPFQAESEVLSLHHGEVGRVIAQHWNLPLGLETGVAHHHTPQEGQDAICFVTYLANAVARHIEGKPASTDREFKALGAVLQRLELTPVSFEKLCETTAWRLSEVSERFG